MGRIKPRSCPCGIVKRNYKILDDGHGEKVEAINHTLTKAMERISSYECEVIPLRNSA